MLTYQQVMTTDFSFLTKAAARWDEAASKFAGTRAAYDGQVKGTTMDGTWQGQAALAARPSMDVTSKQYEAAQKEARAIASILRDAHAQFTSLRNKVKAAVTEAVEAGMKVDAQGIATFDYSKQSKAAADAMRRDPEFRHAEHDWTKRIESAVAAIDDADYGVKLALRAAVTGSASNTFLTGTDGFNSLAEGDIEKVEADAALKLANKLNSAGHLSATELAEMNRLFRDNNHDTAFSRTLLDSLGPKGTILLTNRLNDLAYYNDKAHKKDYLTAEKGLATTLATATRLPKWAEKYPIGSKEYNQKYQEWLKSSDSSFYREWHSGLKKAGVETYDLEAVTNRVNSVSPYRDQQTRGYQSLVTLMQQGSGYSPQFLHDLADDIRTAEDKSKGGNPNIWDLQGDYSGKRDGWFANDPLDGVLNVMSHEPGAATAYLDPNSDPNPLDNKSEQNDRLNYLLSKRDWNVVDTVNWHGELQHAIEGADAEDKDSRSGLAAALEAATTGNPSGSPEVESSGRHSIEQARVMHHTIELIDKDANGESVHRNLQAPLARSLANYAGDTHKILSDDPEFDHHQGGNARSDSHGGHINPSKASLTRILRGLSESPDNFTLLYEAERSQAAESLTAAPATPGRGTENWDTRAREAGRGLGTFNAIGTDVILDNRDTRKSWADDVAKYSYHGGGTPITAIPIVGDAAQRVLDAATYEWANDVKAEADQVAKAQSTRDLEAKSKGVDDLINNWAIERKKNPFKDAMIDNMRDEASQSYVVSRTTALTILGRS